MAMNARGRIILALALVLLGAALLIYGVSFHAAAVQAQTAGAEPAVAQSERSLIREVTVGGVQRDESGQIRKTYSGNQVPKACPT